MQNFLDYPSHDGDLDGWPSNLVSVTCIVLSRLHYNGGWDAMASS